MIENMNNVVVVGPAELQETVKVNSKRISVQENDFTFDGIDTYIGGHGCNVARVLQKLGRKVSFVSLIGQDVIGDIVFNELIKSKISTEFIEKSLKESSHTVIAYDKGFRKFFIDLKDVQQTDLSVNCEKIISESDIVLASNINYARPIVDMARKMKKTIAIDIHDQDNVEDEYNKFFMENADILFMSNEKIIGKEKDFLKKLINRYDAKIIVIGMGSNGALMYDEIKEVTLHYKPQMVKEVNCVFGTGDAFFASFIHFYCKKGSSESALDLAMTYAEKKIRHKGPDTGLLTEEELVKQNNKIKREKEIIL